jgi:hypothetical protein
VHHSTAATLPARAARARRSDAHHGDSALPHASRPRLIDTHLVRAELLRLRGAHAALTVHRHRPAHARPGELS